MRIHFYYYFHLYGMSRIDLQDRIMLLKLFYKNNECVTQTLRSFNTLKNIKKTCDSISPAAVRSIISRFNETGSVQDKARSGRQSSSVEKVETVTYTLMPMKVESVFAEEQVC